MECSTWPKNLSSSSKRAIEELLHGQNPTKKPRDLFDAHSQAGNDTGQPLFSEDLIVNALKSFSNTLSLSSSSESYEVFQVPANACVMSEVSQESESIKNPVPRTLTSMERSAWPKNLCSSRKCAIQELLHAQKSVKKLRDLFNAHSQAGNNTGQPLFVEDLVVKVLMSFSKALSVLGKAESYEVLQVLINSCVRNEDSDEESIHFPVPRKTSDTWTRLDQNLINGHQWRTSDQKSILNSLRKTPIEEILKCRIEVQLRLEEQLEVKKMLQMRIEALVKYLQAIIVQIADFNLEATSNFVDPARGGGGGGGERNNSNIINTMMGMKEEMNERGGLQNHGSASQIYEGEAATLARSSSNPPNSSWIHQALGTTPSP